MWSEDEDLPSATPLPSGALYSLRAARRPPALKLFPMLAAIVGAAVAVCFTIVGVGLGEKTIFYCLFSVPLAMSIGIVWGGAQADRMMGR